MGYTLTRVPIAVYPIIATVVGAVSVGTWYVARLATREQVVWSTKKNPFPYLSIKEGETTKLMNPNGRFKSSWVRNAL